MASNSKCRALDDDDVTAEVRRKNTKHMSELATQRQANARQRIAAFDADLAVRLAADSSLPAPISEDTLMRLHERLLARYCVACLSSLRREMFVTAGHWGRSLSKKSS